MVEIIIVGLQYVMILLSFLFITFVAYQKRTALCSHLLLCSIAVLINTLSYSFELTSGTIEEALMAIRFEYFGMSTATIAAVLFVCELFHVRVKNWVRGILVLTYFVSCMLVCSNEYHHLHYERAWIETREHIAIFRMVPGPNYIFHTVITFASLMFCIGMIIYVYVQDAKRKEDYRKYLFLGIAALIPLLCACMRLSEKLNDYDFIPFGLFCTNACFILVIFFFRSFDIAESAKDDILETLEEGILVCDEDGSVVYQNKRIKEIFRTDSIESLAEVFGTLTPTEDGEFCIEDRYYTVTESEVYEDGRVSGKTWCFIDMTQTKEREHQLKELNQEATAANSAKSNFLANMSHEIRTPINTILGMNELILRESKSLNVLEYAGNIKNEGKTLMSLINDLLDFSKIESGKMELMEEEYDTSALFHDVVAMFSLKTEEKGLVFQIDVAEDLPSVLYGDEIRIKQILSNLLTNAVKYTERGSIGLTVDWTLEENETAGLVITVSDSGIGIRREDIDKIFDKFKRLDSKRNSQIEGVGLGMNITAQLLSIMQGEITIESEYGIGSEFKVRIPQKIVDASPVGSHTYVRKKKEVEKPRIIFTAPKARILVVDDNVMNRVVVKGLLKHTLLQIEEAGSGTECLEKTKNTRYDIILLDHMMPGMDGVETLQHLQKQEGMCKNAAVLVLTANAMAGVKDYYMSKGFDDYMSKPISGSKLEKMLLKYLPEELVLKSEEEQQKVKSAEAGQKEISPQEIRKALSIERISGSEGLEHMDGNREMYRGAAKLFATLCDERLRTLHEYIRTEDVPAYTTLIHAIKSDAEMLGAKELAEMAWEQEKMGKEGNLAFLMDKFGLLSMEYQRVAGCFERIFNEGEKEGGE